MISLCFAWLEKFAEMKEAVIALMEKYPFVRMDYYGFRDDWKETL